MVSTQPALNPSVAEHDDRNILDGKDQLDARPPSLKYTESSSYGTLQADPAIVGHPWRIKGPALLAVLFMTRAELFPLASKSSR
jgi:hypothetical protein